MSATAANKTAMAAAMARSEGTATYWVKISSGNKLTWRVERINATPKEPSETVNVTANVDTRAGQILGRIIHASRCHRLAPRDCAAASRRVSNLRKADSRVNLARGISKYR